MAYIELLWGFHVKNANFDFFANTLSILGWTELQTVNRLNRFKVTV